MNAAVSFLRQGQERFLSLPLRLLRQKEQTGRFSENLYRTRLWLKVHASRGQRDPRKQASKKRLVSMARSRRKTCRENRERQVVKAILLRTLQQASVGAKTRSGVRSRFSEKIPAFSLTVLRKKSFFGKVIHRM